MNKSILIVGGDSKIGESLSLYFKSKKFDVYETTRHNTLDQPEKSSIRIDLEDIQTFKILREFKFNFVIFCAGISSIKICYNLHDRARLINVVNTNKLISVLADMCDKLIFISSSQVFSKADPQLSSDIPNPNTIYGVYKREVEDYIKHLNRDNIHIIRITKVMFSADKVFSEWDTKIREGINISVCQNLFLSPINEFQLSEKLYLCLTSPNLSQIVHLSACDQISYLDLATLYLTHKNISFDFLDIRICKEDLRKGIRPNLNSVLIEKDVRFKLSKSLDNIKCLLN